MDVLNAGEGELGVTRQQGGGGRSEGDQAS